MLFPSIHGFVAAAANANLAAIGQQLVADAHGRIALVAHEHHVGGVNRRLLFDDAACLLRPARLTVPLHDIEPLDDHGVLVGQHAQHLAGLAALLAADHHNAVVLANLHG